MILNLLFYLCAFPTVLYGYIIYHPLIFLIFMNYNKIRIIRVYRVNKQIKVGGGRCRHGGVGADSSRWVRTGSRTGWWGWKPWPCNLQRKFSENQSGHVAQTSVVDQEVNSSSCSSIPGAWSFDQYSPCTKNTHASEFTSCQCWNILTCMMRRKMLTNLNICQREYSPALCVTTFWDLRLGYYICCLKSQGDCVHQSCW